MSQPTPGSPPNEEQLLRAAAAGDEAAFVCLYRLHRDNVFRFAYRLLGSAEGAKDVTQECFATLAHHPESFDASRSSLGHYLCGVARNQVYKRLRIAQGHVPMDDEVTEEIEQQELQLNQDPQPLRQVLAGETVEAVRKALANLPLVLREAVILYEYEGLSLEEISRIVGADLGAVKARVQRARKQLKARLAPYRGTGSRIVSPHKEGKKTNDRPIPISGKTQQA